MEVTELGRLARERRADGRLWAVRGEAERAVRVRRCFPWSAPARLLSLRDDDDTEFALVRDPGELDAASRLVLEEALVAAGFVFEVTRVTAIDEEGEIRHWQGGTPPGPRAVSTRARRGARPPPPGGFFVPGAGGG